MKPLLKWPGGKTGEIKLIEQFIPQYERYIEPFFGGGAVFFHLPPGKAVLNDISKNLMGFYTLIKQQDQKFERALHSYNQCWKLVGDYFDVVFPELCIVYEQYRRGMLTASGLTSEIITALGRHYPLFLKLFSQPALVDCEKLFAEIQRNCIDKMRRMKQLEYKMQQELHDGDLRDNMETGFRSGFYVHARNLYNAIALREKFATQIPAGEKAANFYFIREYCYGSMFRYNRSGEFNIPYGGIAYNKKNFTRKVDRLFQPETKAYFQHADLCNMDFQVFLTSVDLSERDFIFLDPPYDSDFSDYEGLAFGRRDQARLANLLDEVPAKFILVIKKTDYIIDLYRQKEHLTILDFDKQYTYNVKSRNNRDVNHLIITNCHGPK